MAKVLVATGYELDVTNNAVIIPGNILHERLLLITDVTNGEILYNFADPDLGATAIDFHEDSEKTTVTLAADFGALNVLPTDKLSILIDEPSQKMDVDESLLDPVNKIRVSNPENLIDTDFEYGLQPTKWETLETSNNIPSFYVGDGDLALTGVLQILATAGSAFIQVLTSDEHGLAQGTPIDVQGVASRTAEGKFLIASASANSFTYRANAIQTITKNIGGVYTTITPGSFYQGSSIPFDVGTGLQSDGADNASVTITTPSAHGFTQGNSFYLVNTVGTKASLLSQVDTSVNAPDGFPYIDPENTVTRTLQNDPTQTETKHIRSRHNLKFTANEVDVADNTITWTDHGMRTNDCVMYNPPASDTAIGGLNRMSVYYVIVVDDNTLRLSATYNGSAITFSTAGTYNFGRAALNLVYEINRVYTPYRNYTTFAYHRFGATGAGSGWDIQANTPIGGYTRNTSYIVPFSNDTTSYQVYMNRNQRYWPNRYQLGNNYGWGPTVEPTDNPSIYNFVEDFTRFETQGWFTSRTSYLNETAASLDFNNRYYYDGTYNWYPTSMFWMPFEYEEEGDTLFLPDHGLSNGQSFNITGVASGDPIYVSTSNTSYSNTSQPTALANGEYIAEVVSKDRVKIKNQRIHSAAGTYNFEFVGAKPTANSIYISSHGFTNDQELTIATDGGTLPTTTTGTVSPVVDPAGNNAMPLVFNVLDSAIQNYITSDLGSTFLDMTTYSNTSATNTLVFGNARSNNILNSYNLTTGSHYALYTNRGQTAYANTNYYNPAVLNSTSATNVMTGTIYEDRNLMMMATDWAANTTVPYYFTLSSSDFNSSTEQSYEVFQDNAQFIASSSPTHYNTYYNETNYTSTAGTPFRWAGMSWNFFNGSERVCYVRFRFKPTNDTANYYNPTGAVRPITQSNGNTYQYTYFNSYYEGRRWEGRLMFTVSSSDSNFNNSNWITPLIQNMIDSFEAGMVYPSLNNGDTIKTQLVDDNRIRLKKNGTIIDFTNNGAGPLEFTTTSQLGVVDGIYSTTSVTETDLVFQTESKITGQSITVDAAAISGEDIPLASGTHSYRSGTAVVYDNNGNADIAELTNGDTYYVIVVDDENIQISATASDAANGANPISLTAGTGNHRFISDSLAGVVPAQGTVNVTRDSNIIEGTDTLFKRFFKVGDTIYIKDNTSNPGAISKFTVTSIADDASLSISGIPTFDAANTLHFVETKVYTRPDGYSVHRPFDGGVEIAAGTAPLSKVTRQTRKYFRYQSGKGIQTSLAINFNPPVTFDSIEAVGLTVTATTKYPHRMSVGQAIEINGSSDNTYNGIQEVDSVIDDNTFTFILASAPTATVPNGIIKYNLRGYSGAYTRAGMFDDQNGFFFEYNGTTLSCCRRSSTTQLSGTVTAVKDSGLINGEGANFRGQLNIGDSVVIRGMTYKVVNINGFNEMSVQPPYRGISSSGIIMTKVETVKVPQSEWNEDKCDGTGPSGFDLNIDKIQMAYMDYSWYGAGKLRFGFKDRYGHVKYVHSFLHNNRLDEAYMRSGNLPAKYEIENDVNPTYAPTLFHWGTSVIMDGTFDDDKAYLFTAPSKSLSFTNGDTSTVNTNASSSLIYNYNRAARSYDWYVRLSFASTDADKFYTGLKLYTATGELNGEEVSYTQYSGSNIYVFIYVTQSRQYPSVYPSVGSGVATSLGSLAAAAGEDVNLGTANIPLVSLRLAPSVDGNLSGALGARDIINRMQLKLNEVGVILTHDCEVKLILNGDLNNVTWENVKNPSLSQLIKHESGDIISGGTEVFSFRASGGSVDATGKRLAATSNFSLGDIIDLGNSILGGDGIYPNGPDVLTVSVQVVDTGGIGSSNPFGASARVTWSESQA